MSDEGGGAEGRTAEIIVAPEGGFTAIDPETGTATQGDTVEEATANLREAVALYREVFPTTPPA